MSQAAPLPEASPSLQPLLSSLHLNNFKYPSKASWVVFTNRTLTLLTSLVSQLLEQSSVGAEVGMLLGGRTVYQNHCVGRKGGVFPENTTGWMDGRKQATGYSWAAAEARLETVTPYLLDLNDDSAILFFHSFLMVILPSKQVPHHVRHNISVFY